LAQERHFFVCSFVIDKSQKKKMQASLHLSDLLLELIVAENKTADVAQKALFKTAQDLLTKVMVLLTITPVPVFPQLPMPREAAQLKPYAPTKAVYCAYQSTFPLLKSLSTTLLNQLGLEAAVEPRTDQVTLFFLYSGHPRWVIKVQEDDAIKAEILRLVPLSKSVVFILITAETSGSTLDSPPSWLPSRPTLQMLQINDTFYESDSNRTNEKTRESIMKEVMRTSK
jgi:hypothetical protein